MFLWLKGGGESSRERRRQVEIGVRTGTGLSKQEVWALISSSGTVVK